MNKKYICRLDSGATLTRILRVVAPGNRDKLRQVLRIRIFQIGEFIGS